MILDFTAEDDAIRASILQFGTAEPKLKSRALDEGGVTWTAYGQP